MKNNIVSINPAEAIFYPAFDKYLCDDSQVTAMDGTMERTWANLNFTGDSKLVLTWCGEVDLYEYDKIICFIIFGNQMSATGKVCIDGEWQVVFEKTYGATEPVELVSKNINPENKHKILSQIELEFLSPYYKNLVQISWFGLRASWREHLIEEAIVQKDSKWEGLLYENVVGKIDKNLVFDESEVQELKALVLGQEQLSLAIRHNAEKAMQIKPEALIQEFVPVANHMYRFVRKRDRNRENMKGHIMNLAIAGYILDEPKYSSLSARMILSLLQMKWFEGPSCCMEGSDFHHVCFTEDHICSEISVAMGFLGGLFTETALEQIIDKMEEVWLWIRKKCMEHGYRDFMNQGIVGNRGSILGAYFLHLHKGGYEDKVTECYKRHSEIIENYLTKDGHCVEGGNYFEYSFSTSIMLWHVYAKFIHKPVISVVPKSFLAAGKYIEVLLSSTSKEGSRISLNCGGAVEIKTLVMIFMTMVCDMEVGHYYLTQRFKNPERDKETTNFDLLFFQYYKKQIQLKEIVLPKEKEILFLEEGLASYEFEHGKLLVCAERNPYTAHFHEDRGQIILEAEGHLLLPDIGTTSYSNPVSIFMEQKEYHNLACPKDIPMKVASTTGIISSRNAAHNITQNLSKEDMWTPEAQLKYAKKTKRGYEFAAETGMLFGEGITGSRQGCLFPQEKRLEIIDEWSFKEEHPLMVTYLSYNPWTITGMAARSQYMKIEFESDQELTFELDNSMVDWNETPVFIIHGMAKPTKQAKIKSILQWT